MQPSFCFYQHNGDGVNMVLWMLQSVLRCILLCIKMSLILQHTLSQSVTLTKLWLAYMYFLAQKIALWLGHWKDFLTMIDQWKQRYMNAQKMADRKLQQLVLWGVFFFQGKEEDEKKPKQASGQSIPIQVFLAPELLLSLIFCLFVFVLPSGQYRSSQFPADLEWQRTL